MTKIEELMIQKRITKEQVWKAVARAAYYRHTATNPDQRRRPGVEYGQAYAKLFSLKVSTFYAIIQQDYRDRKGKRG